MLRKHNHAPRRAQAKTKRFDEKTLKPISSEVSSQSQHTLETETIKLINFLDLLPKGFLPLGRGYKLFKSFIGIIWALILSVTCVGWISWGNEWNEIIRTSEFIEQHQPLRNHAINLWKDKLYKIRISESREYIVDFVGLPQKTEIFQYENCECKKDIYVNHYFTMVCVYKNDALEGFLIISNKKEFDYTSYRSGVELMNDSISSAAQKCDDLYAFYTIVSANVGFRWDNNKYYIECRTQHSMKATPNMIIGYGICDLSEPFTGTLTVPSDLYDICLSKDDLDVYKLLSLFENEEIQYFRNTQKINSVIVFNYDIELLKKSLVNYPCLGMCKDDYYNLCDNYSDRFQ